MSAPAEHWNRGESPWFPVAVALVASAAMSGDGDGAMWASWAIARRAEAEEPAAATLRSDAEPTDGSDRSPAATSDDPSTGPAGAALSAEDLRSYRRVRTVIDALVAHQPHPADDEVRR